MLINELLNYLKEKDYNHFLLALFAPNEVREEVGFIFSLFNELDYISFKVKEPTIRLIRLKWWEEAIEEFYVSGNVKNHPILNLLYKLKGKFEKDQLLKLIRAKEREIEEETIEAIENYHISLYELLFEVVKLADKNQAMKLGVVNGLISILIRHKYNEDINKKLEEAYLSLNQIGNFTDILIPIYRHNLQLMKKNKANFSRESLKKSRLSLLLKISFWLLNKKIFK